MAVRCLLDLGTTPLLPGAVVVPGRRGGSGSRDPEFGVCRLCHGPARPDHRLCWSCRVVLGRLDRLAPPVVPAFLFALGSGAHAHLVGYKASPSSKVRGERQAALATLLGGFLERHRSCLLRDPAAGAVLVPVPSTTGGRPSWSGVHPLVRCCEEAVAGVPSFEVCDSLAPGSPPASRLSPSRTGFVVARGRLPGLTTAVVVDDVFASGARALSAAASLEDAGVRVAAVVPLGRLVRPDHNRVSAAYWRAMSRHPAVAERCCACPGAGRSGPAAWAAPRAGEVVLRLAA